LSPSLIDHHFRQHRSSPLPFPCPPPSSRHFCFSFCSVRLTRFSLSSKFLPRLLLLLFPLSP
jgi:hypothetical protein